MAKRTGRAGKRAVEAGRDRSRARKSGSRKAGQASLASRKRKSSSATESLKEQLKTSKRQQQASAEILRAVANTSGDAEHSLQRIAETTARLFGASSVRIRLVKDSEWGSTFHVGRSSEAVRSAVPDAKARIGASNLPGTVVAENRQIHIPDLDHIPSEMADWPGLPPARAAGARVISGTPLRRGSEVIGVLIVHRDRLMPFTPEELALQQSFADQAVIAIENARLFNETKEALARQTASADILRVISGSPTDVQPVFDAIVRTAVRLLGCDRAFFMRVDGRTFSPVAGVSRDGPFRLGEPNRPIDPTANFPSQAIATKQILHLPDWAQIELPEFERGIHEQFGVNSSLYLPLLRGDDCIGLLILVGSQPNMFSESGIALAESFRDQALIAIENTRLFNETKEALSYQTGSSSVLRVIASSPADVAPVLDAIVESARELCEADDSIVLLKDGDHLRFNAHAGPIPVNIDKWPIGPGWTAGLACLDRRPVHVHDMLSEEGARFPDARTMGQGTGAAIRTVLSVPLVRGSESIGAILLRRAELRPFSQKQINLLSTFADQAVIAIQNANLFNETREALERQTATADILKVIASSPSDVQPVFEAIATSANRLLGGFSTAVYRFVDGGIAHLAAFTPTTPAADNILKNAFPRPVSDFPRFELTLSGTVVQLPDIAEEPSVEVRQIAEARGFRSMLAVPLISSDETIGLVTVTRTEPGRFAEEHVQLLRTFADQAVIAIENVRLFEEVQAKTHDLEESLQQQTATAEVLKVISRSAFDLQTVLETLTRSAVELSGARRGVIFLRDGELFRFRASSYADLYPDWVQFLKDNPQRAGHHSAIARAISSEKTICVPDVSADPEIKMPAALAGIRAVLAVPLLRDGKVEGVMALSREVAGPFTERQIDLVQTFADQAVIAIENVRLFEEVQARTKELLLSLDELRTAQDRLIQTEKLASLGQLTAGIAHEIKNPLNFVNNFSALSADLTDELNDLLKSVDLSDEIQKDVEELTGLLKGNLEKVVQHGKRADSIVKNMLLHSREGSGEHRPSDVNALVDESLNLAYHGARAEKPQFNVTLQREFDPDAGMIEAFPQEITRVLLNLISNGFYAVTKRKADDGGADFEPLVTASTRGSSSHVEIRIRDNGTGIPPDVKERMFNPFFTTKPAGEGTGLGLSMSHDIVVKQHGGTIEVETLPGEFTEFMIRLPRKRDFKDGFRG